MESAYSVPMTILVIGGLVVLTVVLRAWLARFNIPGLVGALLLGFMLSVINSSYDLIPAHGEAIFELLGNIGLICLLFRVGLESNLHQLIAKLPRAIPIWFGNVVLSGLSAYLVCFYVFGLGLIPSLFVGAAFTATSIAVSVEVWREENYLNGPDGETLLDVAELDDISAIVLMALLMATATELRNGNNHVLQIVLETGAEFLVKFVAFALLCLIFAKYVEKTVTGGVRPMRTSLQISRR